jgi:hypothetical protein
MSLLLCVILALMLPKVSVAQVWINTELISFLHKRNLSHILKKTTDGRTDMDGPIGCSSLTLFVKNT